MFPSLRALIDVRKLCLDMIGTQKPLAHDDLIKRDKINLDIFWLKDESLEESANLPAPGVIAQDIMEDLQAALEQFATIAEDLKIEV